MYIKEIYLKNYRNYKELNIDFNNNVNLILGSNAQGKTNLIEAVYLTSFGKSFRTNHDDELIKFNEKSSKIKIVAKKKDEEFTIDIDLKKDKKSIKKDNINIRRISDLVNNVLVVIFSPDDLKIVKENPEKRRKFIDREICQISPKYYNSIVNYKKIISQRNSYLKEENVRDDLLDIWDIQLSKYGSTIIKKRLEFIEKLNKFSKDIHNKITNGQEELNIEYLSNIPIKESLKEQESCFYEIIKNNISNDKKLRSTGRGIHKDDLNFYINSLDVKSFGSQGQQRTCAISLKLAELNIIKEETDEDAILLLDDVMSELDSKRQEFLIETLKNNQLFITTTEMSDEILSKFPNSKVFNVNNGMI